MSTETADSDCVSYDLDPSICHYIVIEDVDAVEETTAHELDVDPSGPDCKIETEVNDPGSYAEEESPTFIVVPNCASHGPQKRAKKWCADPNSWKQNARKLLYQSGREHITTSGKIRPAKVFTIPLCRGCKPLCCSQFDPDELREMFDRFWQLDTQNKRHYLSTLIHEQEVKRVRTKNEKSRRSCSRYYYLAKKSGKRESVCRSFFCGLFSISPQFVATICSKRREFGILEAEMRGKRTPKHALTEQDIEYIKEHINSYPKVVTHNRRSTKTRGYLSHELNLNMMYKEFKKKCDEEGKKAVCAQTYRKIFKTHFNLYFLRPEKDPIKSPKTAFSDLAIERCEDNVLSQTVVVGHRLENVITIDSQHSVENVIVSDTVDRCVENMIANAKATDDNSETKIEMEEVVVRREPIKIVT